MMTENLREAFRQGFEVWAHESELFFKPWGFELDDIRIPIDLWQGEHDRQVPPFMGRYLAETLSNCTARFCPDIGHTVFATHAEDVVRCLTEADRRPDGAD